MEQGLQDDVVARGGDLLAGYALSERRVVKCFEGQMLHSTKDGMVCRYAARYMQHESYGDLYGRCTIEARFSTHEGQPRLEEVLKVECAL